MTTENRKNDDEEFDFGLCHNYDYVMISIPILEANRLCFC